MSAAVVASRSIAGHSVVGVSKIALTRSISREIASDAGGAAPGLCVVDAAGGAVCADAVDAESAAARFAPQLPQNVAPSAIVVPHLGQFMSSSFGGGSCFAAPFCAESDGRINASEARRGPHSALRCLPVPRSG